MNELNRRRFLRTVLAGSSGVLFTSSSFAQMRGKTILEKDEEQPIIKRTLGKTGIELPVVSFGVMRLDSPALIQEAIKKGMIHFDTAHGYQRGKNEEMLGEALKDVPRDAFILATKVKPEENDPSPTKTFLEKLDISLERLKIQYADILYVHAVTSREGALSPPLLEAVTTARKTGRARFVGVSTHRHEPEVIQAAIESNVYDVVLTAINYKQDHYAEVKKAIAAATKAGLGIVAMKTMAGGFHDKERKQPINCKAALKFVLQDENITTSIPGITNFDQLIMNASVNHDLTITPEEQADLTTGKSEGGLYCQGCEQCIPNCPKGLPIPDLMRAYMYTYGYHENWLAHSLLTNLKVTGNPCAGCSSCSTICKKGYNVSERITDVIRLANIPEEFLS